MSISEFHVGDEAKLDQLEASWRSGTRPCIADFLQSTRSGETCCDLVEVDLEYRWRRYGARPKDELDAHGFPEFPHITDYVRLAPQHRDALMAPRMIAEEFRVRCLWGDSPNRDTFRDILPERNDDVQRAIQKVVAEIQLEHGPSHDTARTAATPGDMDTTWKLGRYQMLQPLGQGGFGAVHLAFDPVLERYVAIKVLRPRWSQSPKAVEWFRKEGTKMAEMAPMNGIVSVHDMGRHEDNWYIVSEYIEGGSLADRLDELKDLPLDKTCEMIAKVADALHAAHLSGMVHRDVKPGNILLRGNGSPVLADFGLAATEAEQLVEKSSVLGTPAYISPEQLRYGSDLATPRSDIYSLGVTLYELLTNRRPFLGQGTELKRQILHQPPRALRTIRDDLPQELETICLKAIEKSPEDRYATASDLAESLRLCASHLQALPDHASNTAPKAHGWKVGRRLAILLLILAGGGWWLAFGEDWGADAPDDTATTVDVQPLREIQWPGWSQTEGSTWYQDERMAQRPLIASSDVPQLIQVGDFQQPFTGTVSVKIRRTQPSGYAGIFWGYHETFVYGKTCAQFQCIVLVKMPQNGKLYFLPERRLGQVRPISKQFTPVAVTRAEPYEVTEETVELEVDFVAGALAEVRLDGQPQPGMLRDVEGFHGCPDQGQWGAFNMLGTAWFIQMTWEPDEKDQ